MYVMFMSGPTSPLIHSCQATLLASLANSDFDVFSIFPQPLLHLTPYKKPFSLSFTVVHVNWCNSQGWDLLSWLEAGKLDCELWKIVIVDSFDCF